MKTSYDFYFLDLHLDNNAQTIVQSNGFELLDYSTLTTRNKYSENNFILVDDYSISKDQIAVFKSQNFTTVEINDLPWENKNCDILINHTPGLTAEQFTANNNQTMYLGPDYLMLRPEFLIQNSTTIKKNTNQILVMMGGTDPNRIMRKIAHSIEKKVNSFQYIFVQGSENEDTGYFQMLSTKLPSFQLYINLSSSELSGLMLQSEFAIVTSSTSALEAIMCGCLTITGTIAENQIFLNTQLDKMQLAENIGAMNETNWDDVFEMIVKKDFTNIQVEINQIRSRIDTSKLKQIFTQ